jgi:hypothetical protein
MFVVGLCFCGVPFCLSHYQRLHGLWHKIPVGMAQGIALAMREDHSYHSIYVFNITWVVYTEQCGQIAKTVETGPASIRACILAGSRQSEPTGGILRYLWQREVRVVKGWSVPMLFRGSVSSAALTK